MSSLYSPLRLWSRPSSIPYSHSFLRALLIRDLSNMRHACEPMRSYRASSAHRQLPPPPAMETESGTVFPCRESSGECVPAFDQEESGA
jgi:hypothetical protein